MGKGFRVFTAIEFAFVASLVASCIVLGVGGLVFGFQMREWNESAGIITGVAATVVGVIAAFFGVRAALRSN